MQARWIIVGAVIGCFVWLTAPTSASAQAPAPVCGRGAPADTIDLGTPGADGVTRQERLSAPDDTKAFRFVVPELRSGFVYVGDQWYDLDLAVYSLELNRAVACWTTTGARARSERSATRQIQLIRPDEQIIRRLDPGVYALVAGPDYHFVENPAALAGFDPAKAFTIRVALNPIVCGVDPPMVPYPRAAEDPAYAGLEMRANDAFYQIAMNYEPLLPTANSLMTFNVSASPPYNDLFDFQWTVNGRPVPDATDLTFQIPAVGVAQPGGQGQVSVTARGAREYPDPDQPHLPLNGGTLTVSCPVFVR